MIFGFLNSPLSMKVGNFHKSPKGGMAPTFTPPILFFINFSEAKSAFLALAIFLNLFLSKFLLARIKTIAKSLSDFTTKVLPIKFGLTLKVAALSKAV